MSRVSRLYAVAESLRAAAPRLVRVGDLAGRHGVSERTIQRDLQELMASGLPVRWQEGRGGGWTMDATASLPPISLTADEAVALLLAIRSGAGAAPKWRAATSAWGKVSAALDPAGVGAVRDWRHRIATRAPDPQRAEVVETVEAALQQHLLLELDYVDACGRSSHRQVEPIGLLAAQGGWYLIAWCRLRQDERGFRLDRITTAGLGTETVIERDLTSALHRAGVPLEDPDS